MSPAITSRVMFSPQQDFQTSAGSPLPSPPVVIQLRHKHPNVSAVTSDSAYTNSVNSNTTPPAHSAHPRTV
jgi:hypothetical protein